MRFLWLHTKLQVIITERIHKGNNHLESVLNQLINRQTKGKLFHFWRSLQQADLHMSIRHDIHLKMLFSNTYCIRCGSRPSCCYAVIQFSFHGKISNVVAIYAPPMQTLLKPWMQINCSITR